MSYIQRFSGTILLVAVLCVEADAQRGTPVPLSGALTTLDIDPVVQQLVESVDSNRIASTLTRLEAFRTRHSSSDSLTAARIWIVSKFQEFGYSDVTLHAFSWNSRTLHNIVVTKQGSRYPTKLVLLIGHYDTISELPSSLAPGVNDNGSGIALILEVARILAAKQLDYTIRFVCFSAEEQGLIGSDVYVNNVVVPENHDIKLVINVDEIGGYRGYTNTMVKVERDEDNSPSGNNQSSAAYTDTLAALTQTYSTLTTTITEAYGSDYMSFEDHGYVITGFYEGQESPHYHHSTDNVANMDLQYLCQVTKAGLAGVAYFGRIQRRFASIYHAPLGDTQDTLHNVQVEAGIQASAQVSSATIVYHLNGMPAALNAHMTYAISHGDTLLFSGWIPKQAYGATVSYFLRFTTLDSIVATFPQDTLSPIVFAFTPDSIPPTILHIQLPNTSYLDAPFGIQASLNDDNGVGEAWLTYRVNGGSDTTVGLVQLTADLWTGSIAGTFNPADLIEYRIGARDQSFSQNICILPASGWYHFRVLNSVLYDFETSNSGFASSNDWQWGAIGTSDVPAPMHGLKVWGTNLAGNYTNNVQSTLTTPVIDLSRKSDVVLTFKHFYSIEPQNDGGNMSASVDSGEFQLMNPEGGYPYSFVPALGGPGYSGNSFVWSDTRFNIQEMSDHSVQFRFLFASDLLTTRRGWYVDDVRIDYLDSSSTDVLLEDGTVPVETKLYQNYPNPFNPMTNIEFDIHRGGVVSLLVYDLLGREVASIVNEQLTPGRYNRTFNTANCSSGVYFYRLTAGEFVHTRKFIIVK